MRTASSFVQIVHILCHDGHIKLIFQGNQSAVAFIGACINQQAAQVVVKVCHQSGICPPALGGGDLLHGISLPKTVRVAKSTEAAFGAHTGS